MNLEKYIGKNVEGCLLSRVGAQVEKKDSK
jgi:hypothetical protein